MVCPANSRRLLLVLPSVCAATAGHDLLSMPAALAIESNATLHRIRRFFLSSGYRPISLHQSAADRNFE